MLNFFRKGGPSPPAYSYISSESDAGDGQRLVTPHLAWYQPARLSVRAGVTHAIILSISLMLGLLLGTGTLQSPFLYAVSTTTPFEIPVFEAGSKTNQVRFVGNPDARSPYKGPPSAEVDAAWDSLWTANVLLTDDEYKLSDPEYPQAGVLDGNRDDISYFGTFEATHQLHCLYTLFRASYVDYYEPEKNFMVKNPNKYHARLDHCTDMLRQKLMCDADAGVVTYNWVRGNDRPVANYNVMHQCRNYNILMDWSEKHAASGAIFRKSGDFMELDSDP